MGFFAQMEQHHFTVGRRPRCGACGLYRQCNSPKMSLAGEGRRKILIVGETPGAEEDKQGRLFIGPSGDVLRAELKRSGVEMFRDCWVTNSVMCRPQGNRDPSPKELECCLPNLVDIISKHKPHIIVPLGRFGITQIIGQLWKSSVKTGMRWLGYRIPSVDWNAWICPAYHPAFIKRRMQDEPVLKLFWKRHLAAAAELTGRPWPDGSPDYRSMVCCERNPTHAAAAVRDMIRWGNPIAFDYESDCLKPDRDDAKIVSCAISDGKQAVSFPWVGVVIEAMRELLTSRVPKMAWNMKHEERWTLKVFGHGVRRWLCDGMLATHVLDNRQGITSLKFQAFVQLGASSYDTKVSGFFQSTSGNDKNKIRQVDLGDLLLYGGLDALYTARIVKQLRRSL